MGGDEDRGYRSGCSDVNDEEVNECSGVVIKLREWRKRMDSVPLVSTMLQKMAARGESYGKGRMFTDRCRRNCTFSVVMKYYCRCSLRVTGRTSTYGCPVQFSSRIIWSAATGKSPGKEYKTTREYRRAKNQRRYQSGIGLIRTEEEKFENGSEDKL